MKELIESSRRQQKITTRQKWIKEKTYLKKRYNTRWIIDSNF